MRRNSTGRAVVPRRCSIRSLMACSRRAQTAIRFGVVRVVRFNKTSSRLPPPGSQCGPPEPEVQMSDHVMKRTARRRLSRLVYVFLLFQRGSLQPTIAARGVTSDEALEPPRIRCPQCAWQPRAVDLWYCADCPQPEGFYDGCGAAWHTFDTEGACPGCHHHWRWTSCLRCGQWSLHVQWYHSHRDPREDWR